MVNKISIGEGWIVKSPKIKLFYRIYEPVSPIATVVIVHGLNEHTERYQHVAEFLADRYRVVCFDQRGHGHSSGRQAHINRFYDFVEDLDFVLEFCEDNTREPLILLGHSMGGQVVCNYLGHFSHHNIKGVITSSANLKIAFHVSPLKMKVGKWVANKFPQTRFPNDVNPEWISHDKSVVEKFIKDPLGQKRITARLALEIYNNTLTVNQMASKIKIPALMLHGGDDKISAVQGTLDFFKDLGSKDKTLKIYDHMYHEIFNEIDKDLPLNDVKNWLQGRW